MSTKIYASQDWVEEKLSDVTATIVQSAVSDALVQAKESGEFKGEPGEPGYTPQKGIDYFDGEPGADYVLTDADKTEIAEMAAELVEVPEVSGVLITVEDIDTICGATIVSASEVTF